MKKIMTLAVLTGALALGGYAAAELRESYVAVEPPSEEHPLDEIISGYEFRSIETRSLQADDFENPGYLLLDEGADLWDTVDGSEGKSCADCHGDVEDGMAGVGSTYPKIVERNGEKVLTNIENQINHCRTENMGAKAWKYDKPEMLGTTVLIRNVDRGEPVNVSIDGDYAPHFEKGKELYYQRVGQLDMACSNCHEDYYGQYIRADHLSQGQSNGFPTYRFKWQGVGSLHRRFSGCMKNIRAQPYKKGSEEFLALELYLGYRGQGLPVETPSVRN
jgi:sulfur-oxidizing protein SoxA